MNKYISFSTHNNIVVIDITDIFELIYNHNIIIYKNKSLNSIQIKFPDNDTCGLIYNKLKEMIQERTENLLI